MVHRYEAIVIWKNGASCKGVDGYRRIWRREKVNRKEMIYLKRDGNVRYRGRNMDSLV